ncbi:SpoIIE family protein phosphatase [Roseisolibacter agri]|uniref:TorS-related protein n=1 Tax=Roseisolibacter agri TaxID=2014610 RepID=A0AA37PZA1_9BACT|nr:SpoIIE family protein phosphatase [Roseisolibacter agri]GLC23705.1 TorS-related protein [Roseisolibacter agri]
MSPATVVLESRTGVLAPVLVPIDHASRVGEARRAVAALAAALGLDEVAQGRAALIATEAAGNLAKHARDGVLLAQAVGPADAPLLELLAIDRGPGMADPARCLRDGFSTAGTPGTGLGAIQRTADLFDLDSHPGRGTVLLAHVRNGGGGRPAPPSNTLLQVGAICLPIAGERACGDAWMVLDDGGRAVVLVVDGLGHGEHAAVAAGAALDATRAAGLPRDGVAAYGPAATLALLHAALRPTRGAAVGLGLVDGTSGTVRFGGVGNVAAAVMPDVSAPDRTRGLVSQNGIVGHQARTASEVAERCPPGALLMLASDGVRPQWRLDALPGLARRHPSVIAATLWRDLARGRDDATVLVTRVVGTAGAPPAAPPFA